MIGTTAEERAECRMWTRRVDLNICEHMGNGYRFGEALKFFEEGIERLRVAREQLVQAELKVKKVLEIESPS